MRRLSARSSALIGIACATAWIGLAVLDACSSSDSSGVGATPDGAAAGDGGTINQVSDKPGSCASPTVAIAFSPMYSAYIPGSTAHTFQVPAIADATGVLTWSLTDPNQATLTTDPTTGGVMVTMKGTGPVQVIVTTAAGPCGASVLGITSALESDWATGNARYNDGNGLSFMRGPRDGGSDADAAPFDAAPLVTPDAGPACTNCHGPTATSGVFKDVAHTPEQTGGFSDQELIDIVVKGIVPDGGYFDPDVILADASADPARAAQAYNIWHGFHQWTDITGDQQLGIVVYLRSLTPVPQDGTSNFGGRGDGGRRDGGPRDAQGQ